MRTIKFRGKWIDYQNRWVYGSLILVNNKPYINHATCVVKIGDSSIVTSASEVDASTVGQFTGLHDKDGREIYEGDIVEGFCYNDFNTGIDSPVSSVVKMKSAAFVYDAAACYDRYLAECDNVKIIGNIHDNHELIKGGAK